MLLNNKVYVVGCCIQEKEGTLFWNDDTLVNI